jgi:hypothetical protein
MPHTVRDFIQPPSNVSRNRFAAIEVMLLSTKLSSGDEKVLINQSLSQKHI